MKRIFLGLVVMGSVAATAQTTDKRFYIGANGRVGQIMDRVYTRSFVLNYDNYISETYNRSRPKADFSTAYGFDAQVGYFFSPNKKWGISSGVIFMQYDGSITIDNLRMEYQSWDKRGDTYRQVVTSAKPIVEEFTMRSITIPLVMKYRTSLSKKIGLVLDGAALYTVVAKSDYSGKATFNYEAIYQYNISSDGKVSMRYDDSPVPDATDWLITRAQYQKDKGDGNENAYFEKLYNDGYNVGIDQEVKGSGTTEYNKNALGLMLQGTFTYQLSDAIQANLGLYYMHQNFENTRADMQSRVTNKRGEYNSIQKNLVLNRNINYGVSVGLSMYLF
jgi:hypothetical protein